MKYIVNIKETNDVNNKIYYVFDSFGTVLGIFTNISLAYDLIISCFEDIENTYKEGPLNNVKKQIDEALRKKKQYYINRLRKHKDHWWNYPLNEKNFWWDGSKSG